MEEFKKMKKICIWGAGYYLHHVYRCINKDICIIKEIVDSNLNRQGEIVESNIKISSPQILLEIEFDYIIISTKNYESILKECQSMGIDNDKIIIFWQTNVKLPYIDDKEKRIVELEEELEYCKYKLENMPYELGVKPSPVVRTAEELLQLIIKKQVSLCRFGDGEFEIMRGKERPWFQKVDMHLAERLQEVLTTPCLNIVIAIASNFGNLDCYTEKAADVIRQYLSGGTRKEIEKFLNMKRVYYDAYVSRPYIMYKDKDNARLIFSLLKRIWSNRNLLIVEGKYSKMGVGNDLFHSAESIKRILCPEKNAFDKYNEILDEVTKNVREGDLVLISLGPTATVLAYDLAKLGIQALDIGQIDNEYEWYLCGAKNRTEILGKGVAELSWCHQPENEIEDYSYSNEIIKKIY